MRHVGYVAEEKAMADEQSYLQLVGIATAAIDEYTAGDEAYLLSLEQTSPDHHDEVQGILALIEGGIGALPLVEFDLLLGIHVAVHKYIYRMWCKREQLPPGPLALVPPSDDPVWRGRHISLEGASAQAKHEQDIAKLLELTEKVNQLLAAKQNRLSGHLPCSVNAVNQ
jgi:hypothetical protein